MPRLLIAASGTGGHIYPALAVAEELSTKWNVSWLGVPDRLENSLVPQKYTLTKINVGGLGGNIFTKILKLIKLLLSVPKVIKYIKDQNINLIFTTGGYISAPAILASIYCKIPVVIHESNVIPGRVTRIFSRKCSLVLVGFQAAKQNIQANRIIVTGTPVRRSFFLDHPIPSWVPKGKGPLIIVMGGSQGALGLNRMVEAVLPSILSMDCRVVMLSGKNYNLKKNIINKNFVVKEFSDEIPALLQHADLAISRSGAGAISELSVSKTPAILIPYPYSTDHHQDANASAAAELGAAIIIHEDKNQAKNLENSIKFLISKPSSNIQPLEEMKQGMKNLSKDVYFAEKRIAKLLNEIF